MPRILMRHMIVASVILLLIGISITALRLAVFAGSSPLVPLTGNTIPLVQKAQLLRPADTGQAVKLAVSLQPNNVADMDNLMNAIYDPQSPLYHQFISPEQFKQRFAPTQDDVQTVVDYLTSQDITVTNIAPNNMVIDAQTTVGAAQQAFHVKINQYKQGNRVFYANSGQPLLPSSLQKRVVSVSGLDNAANMKPNTYRHIAGPPVAATATPRTTATPIHPPTPTLTSTPTLTVAPMVNATPTSTATPILTPTVSVTGTPSASTNVTSQLPTGYGYNDLTAAYDITPLHNQNILGDNQNIALFALDGYLASDVAQYAKTYKLSVPTQSAKSVFQPLNVLVDNYTGDAGSMASEVTFDLEMIATVAPHANVIVYEGPANLNAAVVDIYNKIVTDNKVQIVSISWGGICESTFGQNQMQALDNIFKQGALQGISYFAASGDGAAYDCRDNATASVDVPASDPYVTAVGGTTLQMSNGAYGSEKVWMKDGIRSSSPIGSGGGVSSFYKQPAWQKGIGVGTSCPPKSLSGNCRQVPDVSAVAQNLAFYCTAQSDPYCNDWGLFEGTSASAPFWSASMALINQYLQSKGKTTVGQANPALYGLFNSTQKYPAFHDITFGDNGLYSAGPGYDMASGIGTPDVYNIARDLAEASSGTVLAQDNFQRSNQSLWGISSDGHPWGGDASTNSVFSIVNNAGQVSGGNTTYNATLGSSLTNGEVLFTGSINNFAGSNMGSVARWSDGNNWYKAYIDGNSLVVQKKVNGTLTILSSVSFAATGGTTYTLRFRVVGTNLYAKVWPVSSLEPSSWMITTSDSALQSGYCGLRMQLQNNTVITYNNVQLWSTQ